MFNCLKQPAICHSHLAGLCILQTTCNLLHTSNPFHWQYRLTSEDRWNDFCAFSAASLEKSFCDPSIDNTVVKTDSGPFEIRFSYDERNLCFHGKKSITPIFVRRLSTKSSALEEVETQFLTQWKWYWEKSQNHWEEYEQGTSSAFIEKLYLSNSPTMCFATPEFSYTLSFAQMEQQNNDEKYKTVREVRRRPKYITHQLSNCAELKYVFVRYH